jgi:hypothetical protein
MMAMNPAVPGLLTCEQCGYESLIVDEDAPVQVAPKSAPDRVELDNVRIRKFAALRRGTYRSRSYALITAAACAIGALELSRLAWQSFRAAGWTAWSVLCALLVAPAVMGSAIFARRALALHREAAASRIDTSPTTTPDFTPLGNGSDAWKKLEDVE